MIARTAGRRATAATATMAVCAIGATLVAQGRRGPQQSSTPPPPQIQSSGRGTAGSSSSSGSGSQTPSKQGPVFRAGVDLVQVDVVVVDENNQAVRGLKASDFTLLDRKKAQKIAAFDEVDHHFAAAAKELPLPASVHRDVADNRSDLSQRLVVIVVDDLHIYSGRTQRAKDLTKQIITSLGPDASMAVLFTSGDHSTQVTDDRALLLEAADTLKGRQGVRRPHSSNETNVPPGQTIDDSGGGRGGGGGGGGGSAVDSNIERLKGVSDGQEFFENMTQYKTLEDAAKMVGASDLRRKAFVLVSEGIAKDLTGLFTGERTPCELQNPNAACYHDFALRRAVESMRKSNVAEYVIDPRGHVAPEDLLRESQPMPAGLLGSLTPDATSDDLSFRITSPVRQAQDGLSYMAEASGGFAVTDTDDFTGGLAELMDDLDHYYLLGFYPSDPSGNSYRPLDVSVKGHPDWIVRYRRGYTPGPPPTLPANADPLISGVMPKTDLPMRVFAVPLPGAASTGAPAGTVPIAVALEVGAATASLVESDGLLHDEVTYQVLAIDEHKAKAVTRLQRAARIALKPIPGRGPLPSLATYQIGASIDLPPGTYQLRASASSSKLGKGGSVYLSLDVPDPATQPLSVSGIVIGYADGVRVPAAPADATAPNATSILPFAPALDRRFAKTDTLQAFCQIARRNVADAATAAVEIIDENGKSDSTANYPIASGSDGRLDVTQKLATLSTGAYTLRLTVTSAAGAKVTREIGFVVAR